MKLRYGIRSIAAATIAVAIFCAGYQLGFERGDKNRIDGLHRAIQLMTGNGKWEQLGGATSIGGGVSVLTTDGCEYYELDASGNRIASSTSKESDTRNDPFTDLPIDDDPFR